MMTQREEKRDCFKVYWEHKNEQSNGWLIRWCLRIEKNLKNGSRMTGKMSFTVEIIDM